MFEDKKVQINSLTISPLRKPCNIAKPQSSSMAISVTSLPHFLSLPNAITTPHLTSPSVLPLFPKPFSSSTTRIRRNSFIAATNSKNEVISNKDKQVLIDRYGLDPNDILFEPSSKRKRRKETEQRVGRGKLVQEEDQKVPRTTHKLLQVLAGKAKRKKLLSPVGMDVRPMMEVVKGAAFGILQVAGGCPASLRSGRWLDLYSGTGSVGIEALSRGCSEVHFVEMDPWVVSNVLEPNLQWTNFLDASVIHTVRVETFLEQAQKFVGSVVTFDYISVTPPYMEVDYGLLMDQISKSSILGEDSFIVVEYPLGTNMLDSCGCLDKIADRHFGRTHLAIYGPKWAQKKRK